MWKYIFKIILISDLKYVQHFKNKHIFNLLDDICYSFLCYK